MQLIITESRFSVVVICWVGVQGSARDKWWMLIVVNVYNQQVSAVTSLGDLSLLTNDGYMYDGNSFLVKPYNLIS